MTRVWYRAETARLPGWDYGTPGYYLVTVCTHGRRPYLGRLQPDTIRLTKAGRIVNDEWLRTPSIRPWLIVDSLVVMPDHCHALLLITQRPARDQASGRWRRGVLGTVVNGVKAACTRRVRSEDRGDFAWQPRFHDVIIRSEKHLMRTRQYIVDNPARAWARRVEASTST
jgi:REP element-mobilizing transposase RayT